MATPKDNAGDKSRDEILKELAEAEEKLYGWQGRLDLSEVKADEAEAQLDPDVASLLENSEDPPLLKKLWYNAQTAITTNIEKGKIRNFALNEKGLFLKKRASTSDQRFSFKEANQEVWGIVDNWIRSSASPIELGIALWDLNEQYGYHAPKKKTSFDQQLTSLLSVPPPKKQERKEGEEPGEDALAPQKPTKPIKSK